MRNYQISENYYNYYFFWFSRNQLLFDNYSGQLMPITALLDQVLQARCPSCYPYPTNSVKSLNFNGNNVQKVLSVNKCLMKNTAHSVVYSVQFSSVYLIPFKQLHDKIQTQIRT